MASHVPVSAPIDTDSAGRGGGIATQACVRVLCPAANSAGTGFLHSSGKVITAEHVVRGCSSVTLMRSDLTAVPGTVIAVDPILDLALIEAAHAITGAPLQISAATSLAIGAHVSTWGYPGGYSGSSPMLSAGYLAAMDGRQIGGRLVRQWVVNAAFNSGNSGGPLLLIETGEVIGVVSSKLAPISAHAQSALTALQAQTSGFMYTATRPDGTQEQVSEGQVVAMVLNELRAQVQLVIGYAVLLDDLRSFLTANGLTP